MIIGITGFHASGKNEAAQYLHEHYGFDSFSTGDMIRSELTEMGIPLGRDAEYQHANDMREQYGFGYWTTKIIKSLRHGHDAVVEGIRSPGEIDELKTAGDFYLMAIEAPAELRFKRSLARKKIGDPHTLEEFMAKNAREAKSNNPIGQQIDACITRADFHVDNAQDQQYLYQQIDEIILKLRAQQE